MVVETVHTLQTAKSQLLSTVDLIDQALNMLQAPKLAANVPVKASGGEPPVPAAAAGDFLTIDEEIVGLVRTHGSLTLNEVTERAPRFSWVQINRRTRTTKDCLVNRGVLVFEASPKPGRLSIAPGFSGDPNPPLSGYVEKIAAADKVAVASGKAPSSDAVIEVFATFHRLYEQRVLWWHHDGDPMRSGHILKGVEHRGVMGLVEHMLNRNEDSGLKLCIAAGRPDATMEWTVATNASLFPAPLVEAAKARLGAVGVSV
jgi:hypothetical protein